MKTKIRFLAMTLIGVLLSVNQVWGDTWTQVTSVSVGDQVVIADIDDGTKELSSMSSTSTVYGIGTDFTTNPAGTLTFTVVAGSSNGTFAFKNGDNYLRWNSENSVDLAGTSVDANTSWTISTASERAKMVNANDDTRVLMWNKTHTRFACYAGKSHGNNSGSYYYYVMLYKKQNTTTYTDYLTECCQSWTAPSVTYSSSLATGNTADVSIGSGTVYGSPSYESSDEAVLTVASNGRVTAVGAGTAHVIVTWPGDATHCEVAQNSNDITVTGNVTLTFNKNDGSGTTTTQSIPYNESTAVKTIATIGWTRTGYTFGGWAEISSSTTVYVTDGGNVTLTEAKTIYAIWNPITYNITYKDQGNETFSGTGWGGTGTHPATYTIETPTITLAEPTKEHYTFGGWYITSACSGTAVTTIEVGSHEDKTFYAKWTAQPVITWVVNNNTSSPFAVTYANNGKVVMPTGANPTSCDAENYPTFAGWTATNFGTTTDAPTYVSAATDCMANVTYYAVFGNGSNSGSGATYTKVTTISNGTYLMATGQADQYVTQTPLAYAGRKLNEASTPVYVWGDVTSVTISSNTISTKPTNALEIVVTQGTGDDEGYFTMNDGTYYINPGATGKFTYEESTPSYTWYMNNNGYIVRKTQDNGSDVVILLNNGTSGDPKEYLAPIKDKSEGENGGNYYYHAYLFKKAGGEPTHTEWITTCCEEPATALSISGNSSVAYNTNVALTAAGGNDNTINWSVEPSQYTTLSASTGTSINFQASKRGTYTITASQAKNGGTCAQVAQKEVTVTAPLSSIAVTGQTTTFYVGQTFSFNGTCTATYEDGSQATVTPTNTACDVASPFTAIGYATATITYTENAITKTTTYPVAITEQPKWTITLNSGNGTLSSGGTTIEVVQGQSTNLPSCNTTCTEGGTWVFAGWAESAATETTTKPTNFVREADNLNNYTPSSNITLYAVYKMTSSSGSTSKYSQTSYSSGGTYASLWSGLNNYSNLVNKSVYFTIPENATYVTEIKVTPNNSWGSGKTLAVSYDGTSIFTVQGANNTNPTTYSTSFAVTSGKQIRFAGRSSGTIGVSQFKVTWTEAVEVTTYDSNPCDVTYTMTFHNEGNTINWAASPWGSQSAYNNIEAQTITTFPTCATTASDWTFVGWRTTSYNTEHSSELGDENEATTDPGINTIYNSSHGYELNGGTTTAGVVHMYPVFTKFIDNEKPDIANLQPGSKYYIYYTGTSNAYRDSYTSIDGQTTRIYAKEFSGSSLTSTTLCADAKLFEFTKHGEGNNWDIRMRNSADDGYEAKSYLSTASNGTDLYATASQPDYGWSIETITVDEKSMVKMHYLGCTNPIRYLKVQDHGPDAPTLSGTFKNYDQDCEASTYYHATWLGSCSNRVFSSSPGASYVWSVYGDFTGSFTGHDMTNGTVVITGLARNTTYQFKLRKTNDGGANYTYYGAQNESNSYTTSGEEWTCNSPGYNVYLTTGAAGDYTITASQMTSDHPHFTVTYPTAYTITFDGNGNTGGSMTNVTNIASGGNETLVANGFTKTDNHFKGWIANVDVTIGGSTVSAGTLIADGATIQNITSNITLTAQWEKKVTALTVSQADGLNEVLVGETLQLTLTVTPSDAEYGTTYTWHSSNTSIMTVDGSGLVTGVQAGNGAYIYVTNNDGVTSNSYYINVTASACATWGLHVWNTSTSTNADYCFTQVGSTNEWRTEQVTLPSNSDAEKLKVLYAGAAGYHSAEWTTRWVPTVGYQQGGCSDASDGNRYAGQDAKGYFRIYDNSTDPNYYLAFQPVYAITFGEEGQSWQKVEFTNTATANNFYTEMVTVPTGYNSTFKIYNGTSTSSGVNYISGRSNTVNMNTIPGLTTSGLEGKYGKFKMNDNYCDASNFNLSFERWYHVTYANGGGEGTDPAEAFYSNSSATFTLPANPYTRTGYTFGGWNDGSTTTPASTEVTITDDKTYTAVWTPNPNTPYVVEHYKQNLDGTYPASPFATNELTGTTGASVTPAVKSGDAITGFTAPGTQTVTILADGSLVVTYNYTRNSYNLTWDANNGIIPSGEYTHGSVKYDASITKPGDPTRTGYMFRGWDDGTGIVTPASTMPASDVTYTAKWEYYNNYRTYCGVAVTFNANGGVGDDYVVVTESNSITASSVGDAGFTREGYIFVGWNANAEGTGATDYGTYTGQTNQIPSTEDVTYYAIWVSKLQITGTVRLTASAGEKVATAANAVTFSSASRSRATKLRITYKDITNDITYGRSGSPSYTSSEFRLCNGTSVADGSNIDVAAGEYSQTYALTYEPKASQDYNTIDHYKLIVDVLYTGTTTAIETVEYEVYGRTLPEHFAIVANVGGMWYALPNNMTEANTYDPVVVAVNNSDASVLNWTAEGAKTAGYVMKDMTADFTKSRFAADDANGYCLWSSTGTSTGIRNYSNEETTINYRWAVTSLDADFKTYTLVNSNNSTGNLTFSNTYKKWGMYASGETTLYFIPLTETEVADFKVIEWFPTKVLIETNNQTISTTTGDAKVSIGSGEYGNTTVDNTTYGAWQFTLTTGDLTSSAGQSLNIKYKKVGDESHWYLGNVKVPIIVSRTVDASTNTALGGLSDKSEHQYHDLVIRDGAHLNADGSNIPSNTFCNVMICPNSKLRIDDDKAFYANGQITLRGGKDEIYDGSKYEWTNYYGSEPQLYAKGNLYHTGNIYNIYYEKRVNTDKMYEAGLPATVPFSNITYLDGTVIKPTDSLYISAWDGQAAADEGSTNVWKYEDKFDPAQMTAGVGYVVSCEPQYEGQNYSIIRFPIAHESGAAEAAESKYAPITYWHKDGNRLNSQGWNYIANPYLTYIKGTIMMIPDDKPELSDKELKHILYLSPDGSMYYEGNPETTEMLPFRSYFVQVPFDGKLHIYHESRKPDAPARKQTIEDLVKFYLYLQQGEVSDKTGMEISETYSDEYVIGDDVMKMWTGKENMAVYIIDKSSELAVDAVKPNHAKTWIPVGFKATQMGEMTFSLDITEGTEKLKHVYLKDMGNSENITDLLLDDYTFTPAKTGKIGDRFYIAVEVGNTTTDIDGASGDYSNKIRKFFFNDQLYIEKNGVIYDATGKRVKL